MARKDVWMLHMKNHFWFCTSLFFVLTSPPHLVAPQLQCLTGRAARVTLHVNQWINFETLKHCDCGRSALLWELSTLSNLNSRHWPCPPTKPFLLHRKILIFFLNFVELLSWFQHAFSLHVEQQNWGARSIVILRVLLTSAWDSVWKSSNRCR